MNSKERMMAAMSGKSVDHIPVMCQLSLGHIYKNAGLEALEYWFTPEGAAEGYILMAEKYGFDGILVNLWSGIDPGQYKKAVHQENTREGKLITFEDGSRIICPANDYPRVQNNAPVLNRDISQVSPDEICLISSAYEFYPWFGNILDIVLSRKSDTFSIHGEIGTSFEQFLATFGSFEAGLMAIMDDKKKSKEIINRINQNCLVYAIEQCRKGIDALKLSSPFAGAGFISVDMYEELVLPYEKAIIDTIHREFGIPCYIHTCGAIGDRLELMLESGTDGLECLDPEPLGTVSLRDAVNRIGNRCFIKGNIDSVNELTKSTEEVRKIAEARIAIGREAKGYILSSACSVSPDVPSENILVLGEVAKESGGR
ncbi:MAG: uroporphyrinogen decarboxylase family protein, partial [Victivallaceae bacterium]